MVDDLLLKYPASGLPVDPDMLHWAPLYVTDPKKDKVRSIHALRFALFVVLLIVIGEFAVKIYLCNSFLHSCRAWLRACRNMSSQ